MLASCREDAVRLGLFIGGFTGSYHLISGALRKWQGSLPPAQNCMAAGTAAGIAALCVVQHLAACSFQQGAYSSLRTEYMAINVTLL